MPLWAVVVIIGLAWVVAIAVIVIFMMGASKARARERSFEAQQALDLADKSPKASR